MFDRSDRRFFRGQDLQAVINPMQKALYEQHGIMLATMTPNMLSGRSEVTTYGLHPKVTVILEPMPEGFSTHISMTCDLGSSGIALAIICYLFCFPLGLLLLYLAYRDMGERHNLMLQSMWGPVHHLVSQPTLAIGFPPQPMR